MTDGSAPHQVEPPAKSKYRQWKDGEIPWDWWKAPEEIARRRRLRDTVRNYFAMALIGTSNPSRAAMDWLLPWQFQRYPGVLKGVHQALSGKVSIAAIRLWRRKGGAPLWALERLADLVGARARLGLEVEAALRKAIADRPAPKPRGLQIIDPDTGLRKHQFRGGSKPEPAKRKGERPV